MVTFTKLLKDELIENGSLKDLVHLKMIEKVFKDILTDDDVDNHWLSEMDKYSDKEKVVINGASLNQQETGVRYNYAKSGDTTWLDLDKQIKELTDKKKSRESFLQNIPDGQSIADTIDGVLITKPPKTSKTKVVIKL